MTNGGGKALYGLDFIERKCPVCGKEFIVPDLETWAYKRPEPGYPPIRHYCSWGCLQKAPEEMKTGYRRNVVDKEEIQRLIGEGKTNREIADEMKITTAAVGYWRKRLARSASP